MEEINNENSQFKYEEIDRPFNYGKKYNKDYDWKKYGPGSNWPKPHIGYGSYFPGSYGPYFPGSYYGGAYGWPWFLLALKSLSPRDLARYIDEMDSMN
ncbi:MAG: hypothetical protein PHD15_05790 [Clostridia bacterium]|nr:hypothetical protein [Clostridia bacterium]MDD4387243.1 hypothetical protein [Clostridia bacterium]